MGLVPQARRHGVEFILTAGENGAAELRSLVIELTKASLPDTTIKPRLEPPYQDRLVAVPDVILTSPGSSASVTAIAQALHTYIVGHQSSITVSVHHKKTNKVFVAVWSGPAPPEIAKMTETLATAAAWSTSDAR
jgi:hypothetical protein